MSCDASEYAWVEVTQEGEFQGRDGAGLLFFRDAMYLLGGWSRNLAHFPLQSRNDVWRSVDGVHWTEIKPNTYLDLTFDGTRDWEGRHTAGYAVFKDAMWIIGGDANNGHYQPDAWRSQDGITWTRTSDLPLPWGRRVLHYTAVLRDHLYVMGGQTMPIFVDGEPDVFYNDVWRTRDGIQWEQLPVVGPRWSPRGMIGGSAVLNDRIWILGGACYETPRRPRQFFTDVWSSPDGIHWDCVLESAPWHPRAYHDVAAFDGKLWVLEGGHKGNCKDVWYSSDGVTWHELPNTPWAPRHAASVMAFRNALWLVTGNNMQPDVWKLVRRGQES